MTRRISDQALAEFLDEEKPVVVSVVQSVGLALDLRDEREHSEQVDKAFMVLQAEILAFMRKHEIPSSAGGSAGGCSSDGGTVVRHRATDPQNIMANVIWLRDILKWAEERDSLAEAYENPDSERTT